MFLPVYIFFVQHTCMMAYFVPHMVLNEDRHQQDRLCINPVYIIVKHMGVILCNRAVVGEVQGAVWEI